MQPKTSGRGPVMVVEYKYQALVIFPKGTKVNNNNNSWGVLPNLAEFMEINDMPMHLANLAALAEKSQSSRSTLRIFICILTWTRPKPPRTSNLVMMKYD